LTPSRLGGARRTTTDIFKINRILSKFVRGEVIEGKEPGEKYPTGEQAVDEKHRTAAPTEEGVLKVETALAVW
jgi:preprotein translocase subunit SecA